MVQNLKFDKVDEFIRIYDRVRYLTLSGSETYAAIYNKISCLVSLKSSIKYSFPHCFVKIKVNLYDFLPIEFRLTIDILIKSILIHNTHKDD